MTVTEIAAKEDFKKLLYWNKDLKISQSFDKRTIE